MMSADVSSAFSGAGSGAAAAAAASSAAATYAAHDKPTYAWLVRSVASTYQARVSIVGTRIGGTKGMV